MRILITGCCGFIGHHIVEHIILNTDWEIIGIDRLSYASNGLERMRDSGHLDNLRLKIFSADLINEIPDGLFKEISNIDYILHLGAETHVDNSIKDPRPFVLSNVLGTMNILDFARKIDRLKKFIYFSTDEVFGPAPIGVNYKEWDRYNSGNPYAASKAGGEELTLSYGNTYKLPIIITHTMNAFGERQHQEKFIPLVIKKVCFNEKVYIHSDETKTISGTRSYIHCRNIAAAILFLLDKSKNNEKYNIVGELEVSNLEMAKFISKILGKPLDYEMIDFHSSRPGHDLRYSLCGKKMNEMGWIIPKNFYKSLEKTINWYVKNTKWLDW